MVGVTVDVDDDDDLNTGQEIQRVVINTPYKF